MAVIPTLARSLSTAVTTVRPLVFGVVGRVATHLPRRSRTTSPSTPETFTPSRQDEPVADEQTEATSAPSPATIARNVAAPRPSAKAPAARKPRSAPGAKLPVRRPAT